LSYSLKTYGLSVRDSEKVQDRVWRYENVKNTLTSCLADI